MSRQYPKVRREEAHLSSDQLAVLVCNQAILGEHVVVISKDCRKTANPIITRCKKKTWHLAGRMSSGCMFPT
jgi:hypothetical protein